MFNRNIGKHIYRKYRKTAKHVMGRILIDKTETDKNQNFPKFAYILTWHDFRNI